MAEALGIAYPTDPKMALQQWLGLMQEERAVQAVFERRFGDAYVAAMEGLEKTPETFRHAERLARAAAIDALVEVWCLEPRAAAAAAWAGHVLGDMRLFVKAGVGG